MNVDKTCVITFAGSEAHEELQKEFEQLYGSVFPHYKSYNRNWLADNKFYDIYWDMFSYTKYHGFFLWKPLILLDALEKYDTVLYCDANLRFTNLDKFLRIYSNHSEPVFIPKYNHYINKDWTKRDTFILMGADEPRYWNACQTWTVLIGIEKRYPGMELMSDYFRYCLDNRIATDEPNVLGHENFPGFIAHRWEQSVFSILCEQYKIKGHLYNDFLDCVDKVYPAKVLEMKKEEDKDPLKRS